MKSLFYSKTQRRQKFLLVSGRLVGAHPDGQQHGVSKESSNLIYWNKRKRLHKKRVYLLQDWFGTPTWPPFYYVGTPKWPP